MSKSQGGALWEKPKPAWLCLDGWAGRSMTECEVVGRSLRKWRIRATRTMRLAGRRRELRAGEIALVPMGAIVFRP